MTHVIQALSYRKQIARSA